MMFRRFLSDERGNFVVSFAVGSVLLLLGAAVAVDYSSAVNTHSHVQNSLDTATLHGAKLAADPSNSDNFIKAEVEAFFQGNIGEGELNSVAIYV